MLLAFIAIGLAARIAITVHGASPRRPSLGGPYFTCFQGSSELAAIRWGCRRGIKPVYWRALNSLVEEGTHVDFRLDYFGPDRGVHRQ